MPVPIHQVDQLTSFAVWPAMYVIISLTPTSYQTIVHVKKQLKMWGTEWTGQP